MVFCCCRCVTKPCTACAWQPRWLQDVANMRKKMKKLKSFSFSRVSAGTLGTFLRFRCYVLGCFGHEIRWCFAVADASQSHAACAWQARWLQDVPGPPALKRSGAPCAGCQNSGSQWPPRDGSILEHKKIWLP